MTFQNENTNDTYYWVMIMVMKYIRNYTILLLLSTTIPTIVAIGGNKIFRLEHDLIL
jgi:hypothetical protein